jgi:NDP-sugar pyrophosphorylase family protein
MLIFIPMSGFGRRYQRAGYTEPKPLVPVDGLPMIARVLDAFPADAKLLFAINSQHARETDLPRVLRELRPAATIAEVVPHSDGPVRTVLDLEAQIPDDEDVLLNYCDFGVDWDWDDFVRWLDRGKWDAAMTGYKGFHPHSLGPTLYAYMRNEGERVTEIREKHHFTPNKFEEYASSGLYYFRRGRDLKSACRSLVARGERVNGEFYASMAVQELVGAGARVGVYELRHFYQWGTPEDLRDYEGWARTMRGLEGFLESTAAARSPAVQVIPMAGRGQRFVDQGYRDPKPLIDVAGKPMIARALEALPVPPRRVLVAQAEHTRLPTFRQAVDVAGVDTRVVELSYVTDGQATTASLGLDGLDVAQPVLFAPCDCGYVYDTNELTALERGDCDVIVFSARDHLPALWRPQMYGWLDVDGQGRVVAAEVKKLVEGKAAATLQVMTGTFWFRSIAAFERARSEMVQAGDKVNGEYYIDTIVRRLVAEGKKVVALSVDRWIPWGTPEELKTFDYWNAVFRGGRPIGLPHPVP